MWFKKKEVPFTNLTRTISTVQLWYVEWTSRYGDFSFQTQKEMEAFLSEEDAKEFADSLRRAFKLIKHTAGAEVTVRKST